MQQKKEQKEQLQKAHLNVTVQKKFYKALNDGNADEANRCIKRGANINTLVEKSLFPLHIANGNVQEAGRNIRHGAKVNSLIDKDLYPLHIAACCGNVRMVKLLIDCGANVNAKTIESGDTPLGIAAEGGFVDIVRDLLVMPTIDLHAVNDIGQNAVYLASRRGHLEVMKALAQAGTGADVSCVDGSTPMFAAAAGGHLHVMAALKGLGVDINARGALDGFTSVFRASAIGRADIVRVLRAFEGDIGALGPGGAPPIFVAAQNGHIEVVKLLHRLGADVNMAAADGVTPVCIAADRGHVDTVRTLASLGADLGACPPSDGYTPICIAAQHGHVDVLECLLDAGADPCVRAESGATPIYIAAQNGHTGAIRLLAARGASVDASGTNGGSPALIAAIKGHAGVIKTLYKLGADMAAFREHASYTHDAAAQCVLKILLKMESECECCGISTKKMSLCARCQKVRYCSRECQVKDHKRHRSECRRAWVEEAPCKVIDSTG